MGRSLPDDWHERIVSPRRSRLGYPSACSIVIFATMAAPAWSADDAAGLAFFETKIRPVLVERCHECHQSQQSHQKKPKGGLLVDTRDGIRKGGHSGAAVVPGNVEESLLLQAILGAEGVVAMPPKGRLSDSTIADFRRWILMGAPDPRHGPAQAKASAPAMDKGRDWWSLRPLTRPAVPPVEPALASWARTPIDHFVLEKLKEHGLYPAPEADRRTLIRRLSFDLIGLPPTPDEVEQFEHDQTPDAYERLVDRLLASPHYGERWARHWMDVVHFAETHGHDQDRIRPNAWPYRDYLIASFNQRYTLYQVCGRTVSG